MLRYFEVRTESVAKPPAVAAPRASKATDKKKPPKPNPKPKAAATPRAVVVEQPPAYAASGSVGASPADVLSPLAEYEYDDDDSPRDGEDGDDDDDDDDALESDFGGLGDESPCISAVDTRAAADDADEYDEGDDPFLSRDPDSDVRELLKRRRSVESELSRAGGPSAGGPQLAYDDEDFD